MIAEEYIFPCGCVMYINWRTNTVEGKALCVAHEPAR
jgi:hypothetical protein